MLDAVYFDLGVARHVERGLVGCKGVPGVGRGARRKVVLEAPAARERLPLWDVHRVDFFDNVMGVVRPGHGVARQRLNEVAVDVTLDARLALHTPLKVGQDRRSVCPDA